VKSSASLGTLPPILPAAVRSEAPVMPVNPPAAPLASTPLTIQKIGPATVFQGVPAEYVISVRNAGQAAIFGVQIEDELPKGAKLLRSDPPAKEHLGKLSWMIERME